MKKTKALLPLVCGMSLLQGAQALNAAEVTAMRIEPVTAIRHSDGTADGLYQMGRVHQNENRLEQAAEAYRSALAKDPEHIEARNALATVYAAQGKFDESVAEFQAVLRKSPELPHVYNNLGYTHFLKKDYTAAIADFGQAIARDPANTRAFANLALVHEQLGNSAKAQAASRLASAFGQQLSVAAPGPAAAATPSVPALPRSEAATPEAVAPSSQAAEAKTEEQNAEVQIAETKTAETKTAEAETAEANIEEQNAEVQIAETKTAEAEITEAKSAEASAVSHAKTTGITIEIANGTRDKALADGIAARLRDNGFAVSRIAPLKPYTQHRTVILYRDGFRKQAIELSRSFAVPPAIVNNTHNRDASDTSNVRLVLGKASGKAEVVARADDTATTR